MWAVSGEPSPSLSDRVVVLSAIVAGEVILAASTSMVPCGYEEPQDV